MKKFSLAIAFASMMISAPACAWDGAVTAKIASIDVTDAGNMGFRITVQGASPACGTHNWAYVSNVDSNYQVYVSALLSAFMAGRTVIIYSNFDGNGFCKIGFATMTNS